MRLPWVESLSETWIDTWAEIEGEQESDSGWDSKKTRTQIDYSTEKPAKNCPKKVCPSCPRFLRYELWFSHDMRNSAWWCNEYTTVCEDMNTRVLWKTFFVEKQKLNCVKKDIESRREMKWDCWRTHRRNVNGLLDPLFLRRMPKMTSEATEAQDIISVYDCSERKYTHERRGG